MASEQTRQNEFIAKAVAKATSVAIQTMTTADTSRPDNAGPKMSRPIMKQPMCDWSTKDKYAELRNFELEVSNMLQNF